ncbi:Pycsar system effector family protein [Nonomuraea sp. NPDC050783]|uniref:Pycsar system effector family protein n=1 Tax=Nonomuraea sp. NPDC050783 TaxID=3154634 RepID=UPI00346689F5
MPDPRQLAEEDACAYGAQLLAEAREELNRADGKAQVLLGIVGIGLGAVAGGLLAGSWAPTRLADAVEWLWWLGAAAALASVIVLASAVYPRMDRRKRGTAVMYFADVLRFDTAQDLSDALLASSTLDLERIADQLQRISRIIGRKFRLIRWGFWLLLGALASTVGAAVINLLLTRTPP